MLPPKHCPSAATRLPTKTLDRCFAADPFDLRFIRNSSGRELTPLGLVVNLWWECEQIMRRECPDTLAELLEHERHQN